MPTSSSDEAWHRWQQARFACDEARNRLPVFQAKLKEARKLLADAIRGWQVLSAGPQPTALDLARQFSAQGVAERAAAKLAGPPPEPYFQSELEQIPIDFTHTLRA
jgi:hypothetical protein